MVVPSIAECKISEVVLDHLLSLQESTTLSKHSSRSCPSFCPDCISSSDDLLFHILMNQTAQKYSFRVRPQISLIPTSPLTSTVSCVAGSLILHARASLHLAFHPECS
ncbi:hypothetical protein NPIL_609591 [Nephila pilipes]|uniref:Uncharacterized protein n=1 Tax=Nephila pilipes TaxID=299642 RepID=A0A8X6IAF5_NEPPI|nr:hypothetical protein NPIL_609591 [Nephila pilipes]